MYASGNPHWLLPPYGAPTASSEVRRVPGFYCAEALSICLRLTSQPGRAGGESALQAPPVEKAA